LFIGCHLPRPSTCFSPSKRNGFNKYPILDTDADIKFTIETPCNTHRRRDFLAFSTSIASAIVWQRPAPANAVITDETDRFADNFWSSSPLSTKTSPSTSTAIPSDEITFSLDKRELERSGLGLELADVDFRTNLRVYVKSVGKGSYAERLGIQKDWIVVAVNGQSMERTNARGVAQYLAMALQSKGGGDNNNDNFDSGNVQITFRDPLLFQNKLNQLEPGSSVTTQVAPSGDTTQRNADGSVKRGRTETTTKVDQRVTVEQLIAPKSCSRGGAQVGDLVEISYTGRIYETGQIFDGSAVLIDEQGIPGRGNDVTIYFVLGKQPFGQFPPGWDVGLVGMCVQERRRILIPPVLGYGSTGVPKRGIPPDATLQYDVTLVSVNGLSTS
jgi:FKBP-type peptidyl-prolyl cis-trans isomerase